MTTAQDLLTIAAELLILSASALYGYLFIASLFHPSPKLVQTAIPTQLPPDSIALAVIVDDSIEPVADAVQSGVTASTGTTAPATQSQTILSAILPAPALPQLPHLTALTDRELIDRAKSAKFTPAKKWGRKLGSGERTRAIGRRKAIGDRGLGAGAMLGASSPTQRSFSVEFTLLNLRSSITERPEKAVLHRSSPSTAAILHLIYCGQIAADHSQRSRYATSEDAPASSVLENVPGRSHHAAAARSGKPIAYLKSLALV